MLNEKEELSREGTSFFFFLNHFPFLLVTQTAVSYNSVTSFGQFSGT